MPILKRFGSASIRLYADDPHPPHFHIVSADFQVLVRLSDLTVIDGKARPSQIADMFEWARRHKNTLSQSWDKLNERG